MNKTRSVNRLFLFLIIWSLTSFLGIGYLIFRFPMDSTVRNMLLQVVLFLPVLFYVVFKRIRPTTWIPFQRIKISTLLLVFLLSFLLIPLMTLINLLSMLFATNLVSESSQQLAANSFGMNFLMIAVIPVVLEELVFRGIFYHAYREKGIITGALVSGLVFGLMHMNFNQFCYAFVMGLVFCGLVEITGSIFAPMAAHFFINARGVVLLHASLKLGDVADAAAAETEMSDAMMTVAIGTYGILAIIATALAVGVVIWLIKHCGREEHMRWCFRRHPRPEGMERKYFTLSLIIAIVVVVIYMILIEVGSHSM